MSAEWPIVVVGIGADGLAGLAAHARAELSRASIIYGSRRQLDLLGSGLSAQTRLWPSPLLPALSSMFDDAVGEVHVVASGDPMLHGIGATLVKLYGPRRVRVVPHVSSVTLACARMGWAVQDTEVISVLTAPPHTALRFGGQAIVLSRDGRTPALLAELLVRHDMGDSQLCVFEQLGGPAERRSETTAGQWTQGGREVDPLNVVAVRYLPATVLSAVPGRPDDQFAHDGQITRDTIRALTVSALGPRPGERLWDVGSGSGSVAVEWARSTPGCSAVAFERDEQRRKRITLNASAFGVDVVVRDDAPAGFEGAPDPAAIFVGGGLSQPGLLAACLDRLPEHGRLVANSVTAESESILVQEYSRLGGQLRRFQHYRGEPLGGFTSWRPQLPITQWVLTRTW